MRKALRNLSLAAAVLSISISAGAMTTPGAALNATDDPCYCMTARRSARGLADLMNDPDPRVQDCAIRAAGRTKDAASAQVLFRNGRIAVVIYDCVPDNFKPYGGVRRIYSFRDFTHEDTYPFFGNRVTRMPPHPGAARADNKGGQSQTWAPLQRLAFTAEGSGIFRLRRLRRVRLRGRRAQSHPRRPGDRLGLAADPG